MDYCFFLSDSMGYIYSIDNILANYLLTISMDSAIGYLKSICDKYSDSYYNLNIKHMSKYYYYENHFILSAGINVFLGKYVFKNTGNDKEWKVLPQLMVKVNPNKHYTQKAFSDLLEFLNLYCTDGSILKYDLAVDLPCSLSSLTVLNSRKEKGLYKGTRYFGQRGKHGFCRIYDKGKESKLDCTLSRIEHCFDYGKSFSFESIYLVDSSSASSVSLSPTLHSIVLLCEQVRDLGGDYTVCLETLSHPTRKKIREALGSSFHQIVFDEALVPQLLAFYSNLFHITEQAKQVVSVDQQGFLMLDDSYECPFD